MKIEIEIEMQFHKKFGLIVILEVCQWVWKSDRWLSKHFLILKWFMFDVGNQLNSKKLKRLQVPNMNMNLPMFL